MSVSDVYGFTTTLDDTYLDRVVAESDKNVLIVHESSTVVEGHYVYVLVREDYILDVAEKYPNEVFLGKELGEVLLGAAENSARLVDGYLSVYSNLLTKDQAVTLINEVRHEVSRLNNLATGRTLRVTVESL